MSADRPTAGNRGVAIVTGGSRGIGAATCRALARDGFDVVINFVSEPAAAEAVATDLRDLGGHALVVAADVSDDVEVGAMFERAAAWRGPIAALVNNAGVTGGAARVDEIRTAELRRVLEVNVLGAFLCAQAAVRVMSTAHGGRGGAIVNVSSRAAVLGSAGEWVHYAATKGAIDTLTVGLAREVAAEGIRVNAVAPGLIDTGLHAAAGMPGRLERMRPSVPMQRAGTADEVAEAVRWLVSDAASFTTGTVLGVGGGR